MTEMNHVDIQMLGELKEIMEDEFSVLLQTYLSDSVRLLAEMSEAIEANNFDLLRSSAHSLKGSSGNVGAAILSDLCRELEDMGRDHTLGNANAVFTKVAEESKLVNGLLESELTH